MEACATAHDWGRAIEELGHAVRLLPPSYVKPFVERHENDAADAEAITEAAARPSMRFVPLKPISPNQRIAQKGSQRHDPRQTSTPGKRYPVAMIEPVGAPGDDTYVFREMWKRRHDRDGVYAQHHDYPFGFAPFHEGARLTLHAAHAGHQQNAPVVRIVILHKHCLSTANGHTAQINTQVMQHRALVAIRGEGSYIFGN